jgi:hypothetical protein
VQIRGDETFRRVAPHRHGRPPHTYNDLLARVAPLLVTGGGFRDPNVLFAPDITLLRLAGRPAKQLYFLEQAADRVVFTRQPAPGEVKNMGRAEGGVPEPLIEKSNREIWAKYGLAIGGAVAPADAAPAPRVHGLVGSASPYPEELRLGEIRTPQLAAWRPVCIGTGKQSIPIAEVNLRPGWNLLTQSINQRTRSFLVYAGESKEPAKNKGKY